MPSARTIARPRTSRSPLRWARCPYTRLTEAAALHLDLDLAIPNFGLQEYLRHTAETDAVFPHAYTFADGTMHDW